MLFLHGSRHLAKELLRQTIWETLNRHRPSGQPDIALVGSRRSGSTILMQIIAHHPGMKSVDQPFSPPVATSAQMRSLGWPAGGLYCDLAPDEHARLAAYLQGISTGRLHIQEPWRFWRKDFHFRTDRVVLKCTNGNFLVDFLAEQGFTPVLYFRHPLPQSLSCERNNWGSKLDLYYKNAFIMGPFLNGAQKACMHDTVASDHSLDKFVLSWCVENKPLFDAHAAGLPTVFYEDLVMQPEKTLEKLTQACAITPTAAMRGMLGQASLSVRGFSDKEGASAIKSGDRDALVSRWRSKVDDATVTRVQAILDLFPGCVYTAGDVLPRRGLAEGAPAA